MKVSFSKLSVVIPDVSEIKMRDGMRTNSKQVDGAMGKNWLLFTSILKRSYDVNSK